jgi:hypothetical protein
MFRPHPFRIIAITLTICRSTIQEMDKKVHTGENEKNGCTLFLSPKRLGLTPVSQFFLQQRRTMTLIRCLHGCYTRFVHVPNVARPNPQTFKHFFRIIKKQALTTVLLKLEALLVLVASGLPKE